MIKLIREHLSTKIFIITVCLLITVGSAIYGMVALGMLRSYFLELDRSLSNQTEKMVLQLSNTSVQEIDGILKMFAISPIIAETSASYLAKETQTLRLEQQEQENTGTYIDGYIAPDLKIQDVEVHITKEMVLMDIGMISGILIIAVLVAGITIMKKRPKQILSEMS